LADESLNSRVRDRDLRMAQEGINEIKKEIEDLENTKFKEKVDRTLSSFLDRIINKVYPEKFTHRLPRQLIGDLNYYLSVKDDN